MQYRTDIEYIASFNPRQAPPVMNYVAALSGYDPIDLIKPFNYCDLGCGPGINILTLASVFPQAQFIGIDLNENHIRMGRARAESCKLDNVKFVQSDFRELEGKNLPQFHFMAISGTLSWLAEEPRNAVLNFMGSHLEPGGLTYLHYMGMPGHSNQPPLCRLASDYYQQLEGETEERVLLTKEFLKGFLNTQKRYFELFPSAKDFINNMVNSHTSLFLHDYLSNIRQPYYFADINHMMELRQLKYAGSAEYFYNHLQLAVPLASRELFRGIRDRAGVESIKDFVVVSGGRTDVYCKTNRSAVSEEPLESVLVASIPNQDSNQTVNFPGMSISLGNEPIASVLKITQKPTTLADLYQSPELSPFPRHEIRKALTYCVALKRTIPIVEKPANATTALSSYNQEILSQAIQNSQETTPAVVLSSSVLGSGYSLSWIDAMMLWCKIYHPDNPQAKATEILKQRNLSIKIQSSQSDRELSMEESIEMAIGQIARQLCPVLDFLGIVTLS